MSSSPSGSGRDPNAVPDGYRDTSDWATTGTAASPREPIGGSPGRRRWRFEAPFYPFQPQQAWLQGSKLTVEFRGESATCDFVTATRIRIRGRPVPVFNGGWVFAVLFAYQNDRSTPARLVLAGPGWYLLTGPQFRRLAEIIETRHDAGDRPVRGIIRRLNRMADDQDILSQPLDWSFRTDPEGLRKNEESQ